MVDAVSLQRIDKRVFKPRPQSQFDCASLTIMLAPTEKWAFDALNFFAFSAMSGVSLDVSKRGLGNFISLERRQIIGDAQDLLGQLLIVNNTAASITATIITSNREIEWTDTSALVAHGAAIVTPSSISIAMEARTTARAAVADGQAVRPIADKLARQVWAGSQIRELVDSNLVTLTTAVETTVIAAIAAIANDITLIVVANRDTVAHWVDLRDATGGTIRHSIAVQAGDSVAIPLSRNAGKQAAVNNNWTVTLNAATTTNPVVVSTISERVS